MTASHLAPRTRAGLGSRWIVRASEASRGKPLGGGVQKGAPRARPPPPRAPHAAREPGSGIGPGASGGGVSLRNLKYSFAPRAEYTESFLFFTWTWWGVRARVSYLSAPGLPRTARAPGDKRREDEPAPAAHS